MKKSLTVFAALIVLAVISSISVYADAKNAQATITIQNAAPTVTECSGPATITLSAGTTVTNYFYMNVTDNNGYTDLNASTALVTMTYSTESRNSGATCTLIANNGVWARYNCSITNQYYDSAGVWALNCSIKDNGQNYAEKTDTTTTVNSLDAISLSTNTISFGTQGAGTADVAGTTETISNTGNTPYSGISLKGYDLANVSIIGVSNVCGNNVTQPNVGCTALVNNTDTALPGTNVVKGAGATRDIYTYMDVPVAIPSAIYTSLANWVFTANP